MDNPATPSPTSQTVYTIGHSNVPASKILDLLRQFEIRALVDVRSAPYSQYVPQFNRETFEHTLRLAGIEYQYLGDALGGRPKDPSCYKNDQLPDGKADFLHLVDYPAVMTRDFFRQGIDQLLKLSNHGRTAVMCSEEDPAQCHRHHLIGRYLTQQGITVLHVRGDGSTVRDQQLPSLKKDEPPAEQLSLF